MRLEELLGIVTGIVISLGYIPYIRDTLRRKTKPQRSCWLIWLVLGGIAFSSQLSEGASNSLWLPGVQTLAVAIVFGLSIPFGVGGLEKRDIVSLLVAVGGLVLWAITKEAVLALLITIGVDLAGGWLSVVKSYEDPESETLVTWILDGVAGLVAMLAVGSWEWTLLIYPFYIFAINMAVVLAIFFGKRKLAKF